MTYPTIEVKITAEGACELRHRNTGGHGHRWTVEQLPSVAALLPRLRALDPAPEMPSKPSFWRRLKDLII